MSPIRLKLSNYLATIQFFQILIKRILCNIMNSIHHNILSIETKISFIILLVCPSILENGTNDYSIKTILCGGSSVKLFIPSSKIMFLNI